MFHILVVEDNMDLNKTVCDFLNRSGYQAVGCLSAAAAYDAMYETVFDCIVSDIMMPDIDGFEFARTVRSLNENIPILFMTARDDLASKQRGFRIGVDDYMVKPVDLDELFLRIGALLRRAKIASSRRLTVGSFSMDADEHTAYLGDEEIALTNREFGLLFKLPFEYTYSAQEQEEIKKIREKYLPPEERETKMELLRRLDAGVNQKATAWSLVMGILSTLVMGVGMCCCLVWGIYALGIPVGVVGIVGVSLAYPVYNWIIRRERERIAPQILKLSEELLQ